MKHAIKTQETLSLTGQQDDYPVLAGEATEEHGHLRVYVEGGELATVSLANSKAAYALAGAATAMAEFLRNHEVKRAGL